MGLQKIADVLVAAWTLAQGNRPLPASRGLLDRTLETTVNEGQIPEFFRESLHFVDSRLGRRKAGHLAARSIHYDLDIDTEAACGWRRARRSAP